VPVYVGPPEVVESITGFHLHRGALAAMHRPALPAVGDLVADARRVAVLEGVVDHTNVGAVFRSAAALGVDAVLVSPDCADPLYRRSVKVSMGAVFSLPYARLETWPADLETVREAGFTLLALTPDERAEPLDETAPHRLDRVALMLGAEGDGLSARALRAADTWVRIPMSHGVDSLNVGAAAAVAFYAVRSPSTR
jgi:tRNA G18 (ribose-2'-O)-methylase SpoU